MTKKLSLLWRAIRHWEFWPYYLFYIPVYIQLIVRGLAARSFGRFTCANPGIPFGGLLEYSKWDVLRQLPDDVVPLTVVVPISASVEEALVACKKAGLTYPFYAKPDRGERGLMVSRVENPEDLERYLTSCHRFVAAATEGGIDTSEELILLQSEAPGSREYGVLYSRFPGEESGRITSIVEKQLLSVTGSGTRTLSELIDAGDRTRLHRHMLREQFQSQLNRVPEAGEVVRLVDVGNHVRGSTFLNANSLATPPADAVFDRLASHISGFYTGRFDLRCHRESDLETGSFQVVEVNGVNSEPAHIYDPSNGLFPAYRDLLRHWRTVHRIGKASARTGCRPCSFRDLAAAVGRHGKRRRTASRALVDPSSV